MKIGIHQHVFTKKLSEDNLDQMNAIRDYGFDSMDVNVRALDIPTARLIRGRAKELGLSPQATSTALQQNPAALADESKEDEEKQWNNKSIEEPGYPM